MGIQAKYVFSVVFLFIFSLKQERIKLAISDVRIFSAFGTYLSCKVLRRRLKMDIYSLEGKKEIIKRFTPKTKVLKNVFFAFIFGGIISLGAELLRDLYITLGMGERDALSLVGVTLILLTSLLTALGLFDRVARLAGAGTLVPITGFSNAVTSEALDAKNEGFVLGVGAKIFTVAGPVILFGTASGVLYGILYFIYLYIIR